MGQSIRLAIVGPLDSVNLIREVAEERAQTFSLIPIVYQDAAETADIMLKRKDEVDVWLFSGKIPYNHAVKANVLNQPLLYIPHTGASLYRALFQITHLEQKSIESISFDTFSHQEIADTFADISVPLPELYVNDYQGIVSAAEMMEYHLDLWKKGKTKVAITCFLATYEALKQKGVPTFRIWPTRDSIRTTLDIAIRTHEALRFKDSQIAIQHIGIDDYEEFVRQAMSTYHVQRVQVQLYELLVDYTESVQGSLVFHSNGQYTIYSTRGIVEEVTQNFTIMPCLEEIVRTLKVPVSGGIGLGRNAHEADENAHIALGQARRIGKGKWMVMMEDRTVAGPLSSATHLKYSVRGDDEFYHKWSQLLSVSTTTLSRLVAAFSKLDGKSVGADDVASYLAITERSARRLLNGLVEQSLAEVTGDEVLVRGRPRKLYRIFLDRFK